MWQTHDYLVISVIYFLISLLLSILPPIRNEFILFCLIILIFLRLRPLSLTIILFLIFDDNLIVLVISIFCNAKFLLLIPINLVLVFFILIKSCSESISINTSKPNEWAYFSNSNKFFSLSILAISNIASALYKALSYIWFISIIKSFLIIGLLVKFFAIFISLILPPKFLSVKTDIQVKGLKLKGYTEGNPF